MRESDPQCIKLDQANSRMQLPKIGWVRYRNSREVLGTVRSVTVSQSAGKWFVSITTLRGVEQPQHRSTSAVGLDWGVASFVSMSNGEVIEQLQPLKKFLPRKRLGCNRAPESCRNPLRSRRGGGQAISNLISSFRGTSYILASAYCECEDGGAGTPPAPGENLGGL